MVCGLCDHLFFGDVQAGLWVETEVGVKQLALDGRSNFGVHRAGEHITCNCWSVRRLDRHRCHWRSGIKRRGLGESASLSGRYGKR